MTGDTLPPTNRASRIPKIAAAALLVTLAVAAICFLFFTSSGRQLLNDPRLFSADVRRLVADHPVTTPILYILIYVAFAGVALPVWWLQLLGGLGFGMIFGSLWSLMGATISATLTVYLARWIAADFFRDRIESRMEQLRKLDHTLGQNGLLIVMTLRLIHLLPFGLCNYAIGLTRISLMDVFVGTLLGSIPPVVADVAVGAGLRPWRNMPFIAVLATLNVVMLLPLLLRYLRPNWFRKFGVQ
jgi:uncharacterized membrane protein YdjX (TVP38/TMEM64 family)